MALFVALLLSGSAAAFSTDALDPDRRWLVGRIEIVGNHALAKSELRRVIETRPRRLLTFWRERPVFDPTTLEGDLERIRRLYETEGYFKTRVLGHLESKQTADAEILAVTISIDEGPRAFVTGIEVDPPVDAPAPDAADPGSQGSERADAARRDRTTLRQRALEVGEPFREADYQRLETQLRALHLDRGHASVETKRSARVRPDREGVEVRYEIVPGPTARIGAVSISGLEKVHRSLIERELTFEPGDRFSLSAIEESRRRLLQLDLFSSIQIEWQTDPADPGVATISVALREKKPRELRVGGGYSTEELARAQIRWQSRNWFGGGRRLLLSGRYSSLVRAAELSFAQPHLGDRDNRGLFEFSLFQQDEANFTRNSIQGVPAFEHSFTPRLVLTTGLRVETATVRDVVQEVKDRIGGVRDEGTLIGPQLLLTWKRVDDLIQPRNGFTLSLEGDYSTRLIGATYDYFRIVGEAAVFKSVFDFAVVAGRLKLGAAQAFGDKERLPIFERLYAGGEGSVRGYRRRQLGPTASNGNPLGGRTLIEGGIETRIPVWKQIGVVGFFDFGQVSLDRYDFVPDELRYSAGPGISYATPIGPISLFAGFPINRQDGEPPWQIHFNIGFFF
ncbi:MAG: BamA/TamA family outer membrane protein [Myxococcota bacterium]